MPDISVSLNYTKIVTQSIFGVHQSPEKGVAIITNHTKRAIKIQSYVQTRRLYIINGILENSTNNYTLPASQSIEVRIDFDAILEDYSSFVFIVKALDSGQTFTSDRMTKANLR